MPNYPSTIPRLTSVTPLNATPIDVADGGGVRVASLAAIQKYLIDVEHNAITSAQLDELMAFWAEYQNQQIALVRADRMVYLCPFANEPQYKEINGSRYDVKVQLDGRRIPSIVPAGYGSFESSPTVTIASGAAAASWDTTNKVVGAQSLKVTKSSTDGVATVFHLSPGATTYNATLAANRKWHMVVSVRMSVARALTPSLRLSDGSVISAGSAYTPAAAATWYRFARTLDASASALTAANLRFSWSSAAASGETLNLDAVVVHDLTPYTAEIDETNYITQYIPPEP